MEDFFFWIAAKKFFTENININLGMAIVFCLLLVLGTRAVRAFLTMADIAIVPVKEVFRHVNKWTGGFLGQFLWVGNCGLWLLGGMFTAGFGFAEHKLNDVGFISDSVAYGIGWTGVGITVIAGLAILRIWLRLEDPKKKQRRKEEVKA